MYSSLFHPLVGGSERQAQLLATALVRRGHSVTVVTTRFPGLRREEHIDGVTVRRVLLAVGPKPARGLVYLATSLRSMLGACRHADVVHVHHLYADAFVGALTRPLHGRPVIAKVACGGSVGDMARLGRLPLHGAVLGIARRLDGVVAISGQIHDELVAHGFCRSRIVRIPNAVDTGRFSPVRDRSGARGRLGLPGPVVSFMGRLDPQKGVDNLLQAWAEVLPGQPDATLQIVGTGPRGAEYRRTAETLGIASRVVFHGEQPDVRAYLAASDCLVLPSTAEGMSNVLLEAMAMGLPCVATRVGGTIDVIADAENGLLVEPDQPALLATALRRLLGDPELRVRLGAAARTTVVEGYGVDRIVDRYLALYRALARPAGVSGATCVTG
jgi:glycosyltransferase involved in cell wall biosynthesis